MNLITRFEVKKLHGYKNIDLHLADNTLILVGENGAGKTTVLHLFYYLLSGQWGAMAKYQFASLAITIAGKKYTLRYADIEKSLHGIDRRLLHHLPAAVRHRILRLLEQSEGRLATAELEMLCDQYDIPFHHLITELDLFDRPHGKGPEPLRQALDDIRKSLASQLLYLPTYRRIEHELSLIFKGLDERELRNRRQLLAARKQEETFVELVEFGMKDVERAIAETRAELERFAREKLNDMTFGYLGDIVEQQYSSVDLRRIKGASPETIDRILNRIQAPVLSSENKRHLRDIIDGVKTDEHLNEHQKVICHYFTKLMAFHEELGAKEAKIENFCRVCNNYMVDKEFLYGSSGFTFKIQPRGAAEPIRDIELHQLSSGEKQIVSLFSHLYLSGGQKFFVLIDEPELSLSVPWQRKFLQDIRNANFCSGLVAVTHSPFIYDNDLRKYAHGLGEFLTAVV